MSMCVGKLCITTIFLITDINFLFIYLFSLFTINSILGAMNVAILLELLFIRLSNVVLYGRSVSTINLRYTPGVHNHACKLSAPFKKRSMNE